MNKYYMDVITRKQALAMELKRYYTGKPCKHGHTVERYVCSKVCMKCSSEHNRNSEKAKATAKKWKDDNPEKRKVMYKRYYNNNKTNRKASAKQWRKDNPEKVAQQSHSYLQRKTQALPRWYETDLVKHIYLMRDKLSKLWGITLHVDHIVPLQGDNVCGLHCWDNLQLLEANLNQTKSNNLSS